MTEHCKVAINGMIVVADPDLRLIIQPDMEFSRAAVEAMPAGQKLMLVGNMFFKPDVPPELIAEKFERLLVIGILVACEGVHGALMAKLEHIGVSITLADDVGEVVRSTGANEWTREYLERLADGTTYVNVGVTKLAEDIPEDLVERKIAGYHNVGVTEAAEPVLSLLKARCKTNKGQFSTPGEGDEEEPEEEAAEACETEEESAEEQADDEESWQNGVVSGMPGKNIRVNGVLDLRGVPVERVAEIESLKVNGVVLMDEANRNGLSGA